MFKVGDKVRCIKSFTTVKNAPKTGEIFTVTSVSGYYIGFPLLKLTDPIYTESIKKGDTPNWGLDNFELVKENMKELEQLVQVANAGYRAIDIIRENFGTLVEIKNASTNGEWQPIAQKEEVSLDTKKRELRIKPTPKFESFEVGPRRWKVKLDGNNLEIGCKTYNAVDLRIAFNSLIKITSCPNFQMLDGPLFSATRKGIFSEGHSITWEEAEKILNALEKAGVK